MLILIHAFLRWTFSDVRRMVLIPIHLGCHWVTVVVDIANKEIGYYDSHLKPQLGRIR